MPRVLAIAVGVGLGIFAGMVLTIATTSTDQSLLGTDLNWMAPYARVGGILLGGLCLGAAMLVIGLGMGRWQHPTPEPGSPERT